jgi:hypothetical protein
VWLAWSLVGVEWLSRHRRILSLRGSNSRRGSGGSDYRQSLTRIRRKINLCYEIRKFAGRGVWRAFSLIQCPERIGLLTRARKFQWGAVGFG